MDIVCYIGQAMQTKWARSVLHDQRIGNKTCEIKCVLQKVREFNFGPIKLTKYLTIKMVHRQNEVISIPLTLNIKILRFRLNWFIKI